MKKLKMLSLVRNGIGDHILSALRPAEMVSIDILDLEGNDISKFAAMQFVRRNKNVFSSCCVMAMTDFHYFF